MIVDDKPATGMRRSTFRTAVTLSTVAILWTFLTDRLISLAVADPAFFARIQTYKSWLYVAAAAFLVYAIVRRRLDTSGRPSDGDYGGRQTLAAIVSSLPGMAYRCVNDENWTMEFVSDGSRELTGYGPDDLIGSKTVSYASLILDEDLTAVWDAVQRGVENDEAFQMSYRIRTASGEVRRVWEQGRAVGEGSDGSALLIGFITDITEHMRVQQELDQSRRQCKDLIRNVPVGLYRSAGETPRRIVIANKAFAHMLGYETADDMVGTNVEDLYWDASECDELISNPALCGRVERRVMRLRRRDGSPIRVALTVSAIQDDATGAIHWDGVVEEVSEADHGGSAGAASARAGADHEPTC